MVPSGEADDTYGLELAGAKFRAIEPGRTRGTAEVVFRNGGAEPVAFTDVRFCGRPLGTAPRATRSRLASVFGLGGGGGTTPNATPAESAWWGFTPSRTVPPGGCAAFRLSLDPAEGWTSNSTPRPPAAFCGSRTAGGAGRKNGIDPACLWD